MIVSLLKNKFVWLGLLVGVVATLLFLYRRQLSDLYHNRKTISDGAKVAGGVSDALDGLKGLWAEL